MSEAVAEVGRGAGLGHRRGGDRRPGGARGVAARRAAGAEARAGSRDEQVFGDEVSWQRLEGMSHGKRIAHLFEVWVERRWDPDGRGSGSRPS